MSDVQLILFSIALIGIGITIGVTFKKVDETEYRHLWETLKARFQYEFDKNPRNCYYALHWMQDVEQNPNQVIPHKIGEELITIGPKIGEVRS